MSPTRKKLLKELRSLIMAKAGGEEVDPTQALLALGGAITPEKFDELADSMRRFVVEPERNAPKNIGTALRKLENVIEKKKSARRVELEENKALMKRLETEQKERSRQHSVEMGPLLKRLGELKECAHNPPRYKALLDEELGLA